MVSTQCAGEVPQRWVSEWQRPESLQVLIEAASVQNGPHLVAVTRRSYCSGAGTF